MEELQVDKKCLQFRLYYNVIGMLPSIIGGVSLFCYIFFNMVKKLFMNKFGYILEKVM